MDVKWAGLDIEVHGIPELIPNMCISTKTALPYSVCVHLAERESVITRLYYCQFQYFKALQTSFVDYLLFIYFKKPHKTPLPS